MNLFEFVNFRLHSGAPSAWKVECDTLTLEDWRTLAFLTARKLKFRTVEGAPYGGLAFAEALQLYAEPQSDYLPQLIVDDVLTTGLSMETQRAGRDRVIGVVVFAREACPGWIYPIWQLSPLFF